MLTCTRLIGAIVLCCAIAATGAQAQTPTPKPAPAAKSESTLSQTTEDVKHWSRKKWNAAKVEYAKQTTKMGGLPETVGGQEALPAARTGRFSMTA